MNLPYYQRSKLTRKQAHGRFSFFFSGTAAKRFEAPRKCFNKKRRSLVQVSRSGSGTSDVSEEKSKSN